MAQGERRARRLQYSGGWLTEGRRLGPDADRGRCVKWTGWRRLLQNVAPSLDRLPSYPQTAPHILQAENPSATYIASGFSPHCRHQLPSTVALRGCECCSTTCRRRAACHCAMHGVSISNDQPAKLYLGSRFILLANSPLPSESYLHCGWTRRRLPRKAFQAQIESLTPTLPH